MALINHLSKVKRYYRARQQYIKILNPQVMLVNKDHEVIKNLIIKFNIL